MAGLRISVIIPALNEAAEIGRTIAGVRAHGCAEVIVVDGGSTDATAALATTGGARTLVGPRGRAAQMNVGAAKACGEVLLFLHADTRLPEGAAGQIGTALASADVVGGCFRLRFDRPHPLLAAYSWCSRFESYVTSFGDQAFFVRREAFAAIGGFPLQPIMEDVELRRRLKRVGRFVKLRLAVTTSARRFAAEGLLRRQLLNAVMLGGYAVGLSPERLKRLYR